jgi:geranylgeranyl diphosphate synthase type 3
MKPTQVQTETGNPTDDGILLQPFQYICSLPGKQIRSKLALAFNHWLKVEPEKLEKISDIVELLHNASLL